ncbi:MAG: NAD(P)/FAD-dependent oxidoreductase [Myxococcota bacterium]
MGAGFGGLSAALSLAERGAKVGLCETLRYPGGCASTFERGGTRYESGATLFSGFAPHQFFDRLRSRHELEFEFCPLDPVVTLRTDEFVLPVSSSREDFLLALTSLDGVPEQATLRFFEDQRRVADALWALFDDEDLLPPLGPRSVLRHIGRVGTYLPLLPLVGQPVEKLLARHGLSECRPLRTYLDAVCQITIQASASSAEAPFALAAIDYFFRGTGHIEGGVGTLAWAMARAFERHGGTLMLSNRVKSLELHAGGCRVETRRGTLHAERVIANLTPHALRRLMQLEPGSNRRLDTLASQVEDGWGAAMLYWKVSDQVLTQSSVDPLRSAHERGPFHLQLVGDSDGPLMEGNHVFCSVSGAEERRGGPGERTVTVSTHVPMRSYRGAENPGEYIDRVHERMRQTIRQRSPELAEACVGEMTASPRTFERFTGRDFGYVGGIPRTHGWSHYRSLGPTSPAASVFLIGDSVFPGQSTLATALGGARLAASLLGSRGA